MQRRSSKNKGRDFAGIARGVVELAIGEQLDGRPLTNPDSGKNPHAVALGKLGGQKGGKARAKNLSSAERKRIAKKAAKARWAARPVGLERER